MTARIPSMKVTTVHEFPKGTWLENIDQRASGQILLTTLTAPNIWQLDPTKSPDQPPELIATVADKKCTMGITEIEADVFAFIGGRFDISTGQFQEGSSSIYMLDLTTSPVTTTKITDVPGEKLLNGLCFLPSSSHHPRGILLAADSMLGGVWSIDLKTNEPELWCQDPLMAPNPAGGIGINGVQYDSRDHILYFSNTRVQGGFLASMPLDSHTYKPAGTASIVGGTAQGIAIDDFDLDLDGHRAFVAAGVQDQVDAVDLTTGEVTVFAGTVNSTEVAVPTAVKIGRTKKDKERGIIYVSTTGGFPGGIDGVVIGGQILALTTKQI